jgi:hypothetical protein
MVVGVLLSMLLLFQSRMQDLNAAVSDVDALETAATVGTLGSALWFLGSVLILRFPIGSAIIFGIASLLLVGGGLAFFDLYPEMLIWAAIGVFFTAWCMWIEKRSQYSDGDFDSAGGEGG